MENNAVFSTWDEFERGHFTPEEIRSSRRHAAIIGAIIGAREERVISPEQCQELCIRIEAAVDAFLAAEIDAETATEQDVQEREVLAKAEWKKAGSDIEPAIHKESGVPLAAAGA